MLTPATYFHNLRSLGVLAIFAAVFAVLLMRAIAWAMRAFIGIVVSH
jgi:hypothetical protein